jgi:serine protease Do
MEPEVQDSVSGSGTTHGWSRSRKLLVTALVTLTLVVGIMIGTVVSGRVGAARSQGDAAPELLAVPNPVQLSNSFAMIADKLEPAVVNISTTAVAERPRRQQRRAPQQDPFNDFFDRFFDFPDQGAQASRSLGSGVIVDKRGFILTNNHVVERASKIQVRLQGDRATYAAKLIGADEETDLAVIKIDVSRDLPVAKLGNSDAVRVGDWVLAIGSPFQLDATVTAGIVSAKDRSTVPGAQQFQRFIQTDAAINPGNSGGPLVNMAGEVIGINTAILTRSNGNEGIGFALPSNTAIGVYNQLAKDGKVTRGSIGITFQEDRSMNPVLLQEMGATHGIYIEEVRAGSPAERAGLKPGDIVTEVNGQPVKSGSDLVNPIVSTPIGGSVRVTYIREKQRKEATVKVEDRSRLFPEAAGRNVEQPEEEGSTEFGLRVEELTADLSRRLGMDGRTGVVVTQVEPGSFADDLGFGPRDVVIEVNREAINSLADYKRAVAKLKPGQNVIFKVLRRAGENRFLTVPLAGVVPDNSQ